MPREKIFVGSDHAGFAVKQKILHTIAPEFPDYEWVDCGTTNEDSVDYPLFAQKVARSVLAEKARGILICGSGIGVSISANRFSGIRAAVVWNAESAELSRKHNDSNILCMGSRLVSWENIQQAVRIWLKTPFEGGRHKRRVDLMEEGL